MNNPEALEHPFNNCGVAPFQFVGYAERLYWPCKNIDGSPNNSVPPMAGGTCAHCGANIRDAYIIRDAKGKEFDVGCQCIEKISVEPKVISAALAKKKQVDRVKRKIKAERDVVSLKPEFEASKATLQKLPHPHGYFADQGRTLWDYYDYMIKPINSNSTNVALMKKAIKQAKGS